MLGSGGVVVIDDAQCIVKFALRTMKFYQHESCGWCIPCREGTDWLKKTLMRFHAGGGMKKDIDNIQYLAENMLGRTFCPLGDAAAMPTIGFVKKFRKEFEDHLDGKPVPVRKGRRGGAGVCALRRDGGERVHPARTLSLLNVALDDFRFSHWRQGIRSREASSRLMRRRGEPAVPWVGLARGSVSLAGFSHHLDPPCAGWVR